VHISKEKSSNFICNIDTADLGFEGYKLITKYTCANNDGRGEILKLKFFKLNNNSAYFFDLDKKKDIIVPTSQIVNYFGVLRIRNSHSYSDIKYSEDTDDVKKYFDAFFVRY